MNEINRGDDKDDTSRVLRVAIVGGGISGLAAAWYLTKSKQALSLVNRSVKVDLFESSHRLGGVLESHREGNYLIERSADNFATLEPDALAWCRELGFFDQLISPNVANRRAQVVHRGKLYPIPAGFSLVQPTRAWPILSTPILSWRGKARLLAEYWTPARKDPADESLQDFAIRRLGVEAFQRLVEPIVGGIFTADPARLSTQATLPQFVEMERQHGGLIKAWRAKQKEKVRTSAAGQQSKANIDQQASGARYAQFMAPKEGMSSWIDFIAKQLPADTVHLNQSVRSIGQVGMFGDQANSHTTTPPASYTADSPHAPWTVAFDNGPPQIFDAVILAVPTFHAARILNDCLPNLREELERIQYASSAVVAQIYPLSALRKRPTSFGIVVPHVEQMPVLAISFTSLKYPGRVPDDQVLVRTFLGGAVNPEILQQSDAALTDVAVSQLDRLLGVDGKANWSTVIRWNQAMPQYHIGHVQRIETLWNNLPADGSLQLAGAGYRGVGIPQCVRSGRNAATEIMNKLGN